MFIPPPQSAARCGGPAATVIIRPLEGGDAMSKSIAVIAVIVVIAAPGLLGGISMLLDPNQPPSVQSPYQSSGQSPYQESYILEVGVTFEEAAVRAALPEGLEPVAGSTGGIAIYGGEQGEKLRGLSPLLAGYVWIDLAQPPGSNATPARYMLTSLAPADLGAMSTAQSDGAVLGEAHGIAEDSFLRAVARSGPGTALELMARLPSSDCSSGFTEGGGDLLTLGSDKELGLIDMPVVLDHCPAEALSARVEAPSEHVLAALAPKHILWASVAIPLRWAMPVLATE